MRAGSTNRLEITPDPEADGVTITLTADGAVLDIVGFPVDAEGTWVVDVSSDELPTEGTSVRVDWRIARTIDGDEQIRTVTHDEWVEGYDADPTYSAYRAFSDVIGYEDWPRYHAIAWRVADNVTFDRASAATDDDDVEKIHRAIFVAADALAANADVKSETYGRYRVEYGDSRMSPYDAARAALHGTGLTYQGIL